MTSIIITYHEEGQSFLEECINHVRSTVHVPFEIIVVDDHSTLALTPIPDVTIIRKPFQSGVGNSFDLGVSHAKYDILFLMACDTRYIENAWSERLLSEVALYPHSLLSTATVGLNTLSNCCNFELHKGMCLKCRKPAETNMDLAYRRSIKEPQTGATILIYHNSTNDKSKSASFRNIVEAKWLPTRLGESFEIPCILGACYATTKEWYQHIDGFWGHRGWGSLEPLISLKSWLMGGSCRCVPKAETGHIWKKDPSKVRGLGAIVKPNGYHGTTQRAKLYNKLLVANLLFPNPAEITDYIKDVPDMDKARKDFNTLLPEIQSKREQYQSQFTMTIEELAEKFNLNLK
jgi:glycosyltransferase involved in cell wall biosynthesis